MNPQERCESLSQTLFAISLGADTATANLEGEQTLSREALAFISSSVRQALKDVAELRQCLKAEEEG